MPEVAQLTPMLRHYLEIKSQHPDAILLYRMGDFYELFFEDAVRAAPILEVTLTARQKGKESEAPMCGVPHHALQVYLGKLVRAGLKVAICDQVEDPATAKGLVKREVTRVVTPGTVSDPLLLEGKENNFLASVVWDGDQGGGAFLDLSTGALMAHRWNEVGEAERSLGLLMPREILFASPEIPPSLSALAQRLEICVSKCDEDENSVGGKRAAKVLKRQLKVRSLKGFGLREGEPAVAAAAAILDYARQTQKTELPHISEVSLHQERERMLLDSTTLANLEVLERARDGGTKGSLLWVLDRTVSAAGGRLIRSWLRAPLRDVGRIGIRQEGVEGLFLDHQRRQELRQSMSGVGDLERLLSRSVLGSLMPREAGALRDTLLLAPNLLLLAGELPGQMLRQVAAADPATDLAELLRRSLADQLPASFKDGGVIAPGVDDELDQLRTLAKDSKQVLLRMESEERSKTGINSLKIRYNKVFGYYLEVTKANQHLVPESYIRKQTLVNAERYITPQLKELEERLLSAEERALTLELEIFESLRTQIVAAGTALRKLGRALAELDVLAALAEVAAHNRYVRPQIEAAGGPIVIRNGRHPVVERIEEEEFVPNDADLDAENAQIVVLTGPNMGGKSTYLRQVALIVLLSQIGSFVPAESARIAVVDRIFTRVGASDDLARGESTFMVEMIETANILRQSSAESLVILDEVGRGTATFDGLSLAWAIVEYLHEHRRPMTLFATHYHELTELASLLPRVVNRTMTVKEWEDKIVFLRRVEPGSADKSYGLHVARLAGVPEKVIARAAEVLANLEEQEYDISGRPRLAKGQAGPPAGGLDQLQLFAPPEQVVAALLEEVDLESLTPLAALNLLHSLKSRLRG